MSPTSAAKKLDPAPIITHRYPLEEYEEAITTRGSTDAIVGKVVMTP